MNRLLLALIVGGVVFASMYAFAAGLNLTSSDLSAGSDVVASCDDTAEVNEIKYNTSFANGGYVVDSITVTGLAAGCNGQEASATLTNGTAAVGSGLGLVSNGEVIISISSGPLAANVTNVHVIIQAAPNVGQ